MAALTLTTEQYRDKLRGAWMGKSAGLTLGMGQRGKFIPGRNNFYSPVPGQPVPSAALDFPLVWLATLAETGAEVAPEDLAVAWLEHLDYSDDECGYAALEFAARPAAARQRRIFQLVPQRDAGGDAGRSVGGCCVRERRKLPRVTLITTPRWITARRANGRRCFWRRFAARRFSYPIR